MSDRGFTCNAKKPFHLIRLNGEARSDLKAWQIFIENFIGKSVFLNDSWLSSETLHMYTDASGSLGYAALYGSKWFAQPWLDVLVVYHISVKELFPIVLILDILGYHLQNQKVLFFSDNLAVVRVINKQSSKDKTLMKLVGR